MLAFIFYLYFKFENKFVQYIDKIIDECAFLSFIGISTKK